MIVNIPNDNMSSKPHIEIFTDGACSGNPGCVAPEAAMLRGRLRVASASRIGVAPEAAMLRGRLGLTRLCRYEPVKTRPGITGGMYER